MVVRTVVSGDGGGGWWVLMAIWVVGGGHGWLWWLLVTTMMMFIQQFSDEELAEMHGGRWENPAYQNMEQLMDERYALEHARITLWFSYSMALRCIWISRYKVNLRA